MRFRSSATALAAALTVAGGGALAGAAPHAAAAPATGTAAPADVTVGTPVRLASDVIPNLAKLTPTGPADPTQQLQVIVAIANPNLDAARAYLSSVSDPASPDYRHFLTPAEYGARFGVPAAQTTDTESRLTTAGLRVTQVSAGGDAITATGTVAQIEAAFGVTEQHYSSNGFDFIANTEGPLVWSADHVMTVIGLDTLQRYSLPHPAASGPAVPTGIPVNATPDQLHQLYDITGGSSAGKGQQLTVIGEGDPTDAIAALRAFENHYSYPTVPVQVHCVDDPTAAGYTGCGTDTAGNGEWEIDVQASTGMAPGIDALNLDFSKSLADSDLDNAFLYWINDPNGSKQASASEGVCEQNPLNPVTDAPTPANSNETETTGEALGNDQEPVIDGALLQAAIEGRTLFASTGDTGATCGALIVGPIGAGNGVIYNGLPNSVDYPAASAWAVAVGGTEIYPAKTVGASGASTGAAPAAMTPGTYAEYAWPYSGGGTASFIAAGDYQNQFASSATGTCLASPDGTTTNTGEPCRGTPDVAAQSGGLTDAYEMYDGNGNKAYGAGTSLSAPLWQGMWADVQAATGVAGGLGFADETIYRLASSATTYTRDFYDVTVGFNGLWPAGTGYDHTTGWGTPDVANIITDAKVLGAQQVTPPPTTPEAPLAVAVPLAGAGAAVALLRRRSRRRATKA